MSILAISACSRGAQGPVDGGQDVAQLRERARGLLDPRSPLGPRSEALALAESVESAAVREGAGARSADLHTLAAEVLERVYRIEGRDQDAKEALLLYRSAARDLTLFGSCEAGERGAWLAGDFAHDASVTYAELYRIERRMAVGPSGKAEGGECGKRIEDELSTLNAFRAPARVLEAIDRGLAGDGDLALGLDASAPSTEPIRIVNVETLPGRDAARVVIALSRPARFRPGDVPTLPPAPPRTFVDLDGVDVGTATRDIPLAGVVGRVRTEATSTGARVSLDLDGPAYRKVFYLPEPYRIVVDIARHPPGSAVHGRRIVERIVVDPGHGGSDPGAIGSAGFKEKDVTLDIARKVAPLLTKDGLSVVLTREDDRFVPLEDRTARANAFGADVFVSIHCNAAENHVRHGIETYVLDTTKDEIASRVAARENATSQAATREIGSILASLRLADQASHSSHLAELLQKAAMASTRERYPDVSDGGVHTAGFYVLVGARMPSVLFETSYISNAVEEERLSTEDYRQRLADAIVNAVRAYRQGR